MCHQVGQEQQYLNGIVTKCGHLVPAGFLAVILVLSHSVEYIIDFEKRKKVTTAVLNVID